MGYIRFFAETDTGAVGLIALEYMRALIRIAPVRVVSLSGGLDGAGWRTFARCLETPMSTSMIANVVCTDPTLWTRRIKVPMPKHDPLAQALATGEVPELAKDVEHAERVMELYTEGSRNVLIARARAASVDQAKTAARYEAVISPVRLFSGDVEIGARSYHVPVPVTAHAAFRNIVTGK